jgi:Vacuolar sorting protein 9 (VPS9) domain
MSVRPGIGRLEFPAKRLNVAEIGAMIFERLDLLQKFLRRVSSLVCVNSLHPSTAKVQLALQQFLEVADHLEDASISGPLSGPISGAHAHSPFKLPPAVAEINTVQVFIHSVMQLTVMDKVLSGFVDNFNDTHSLEAFQAKRRQPTEADGRAALNAMKEFVDNLETVLYDALVDDGVDIIRKYRSDNEVLESAEATGPGGSGRGRPGKKSSGGVRYIDARSTTQSSQSESASSSSNAIAATDENEGTQSTGEICEEGNVGNDEEAIEGGKGASADVDVDVLVADDTFNKSGDISSSLNDDEPPDSSDGVQGKDRNGNATLLSRAAAGDIFHGTMKSSSADIGDAADSNQIGNDSPAVSDARLARAERDRESWLEKEKERAKERAVENERKEKEKEKESEKKRRDAEAEAQVIHQCNEDEMRALVRSAIRRQVEIEVYVPCAARLRMMLDEAFSKEEAALRRNVLTIAHQPQTFYGIPVQHISPSSWECVVLALRDLRSKTLPHDRLEALLAAAKEIPELFIREHPGSDKPLGADDFLPIFIYVLARAQIPDLLSLNEELQALCDPEKRMSETGYYLATLEASVQHIAEADVSADSEYLFPEMAETSRGKRSVSRSTENSRDDGDEDGDDEEEDDEDDEFAAFIDRS